MDSILHGGRLHQARRRYPAAPTPFLDLSTGINPAAYPFSPPPREAWTRLPEPEDVARLEAAAARAYGVADPLMVVAAPGTQALIQLLPRVLPQPAINVVGPTYAEHAATWSAAGSVVRQAAGAAGEALVLCNPNNPDGARVEPAVLAARARDLALLVVDEAFADFEPKLSLAPYLPLPNVVVLRSFGKSYGLAGLRLGFALAEPGLATQLREALGPWAVSGPAIAVGTEALNDTNWRDAAALETRAASVRLDAVLYRAGLRVVGGTSLFRLAEAADAAAVADRLGRAGILVRSFADAPNWLRFGLPGADESWARLDVVLG